LLQHIINLTDSGNEEKYKLVEEKMTWKEAAKYCNDTHGSDLVSFQSSKDTTEFKKFMNGERINYLN